MSSRLQFDNIMKLMSVQQIFTGVTLVSTEIDFDIPRGFIVKVHRAVLEHRRIAEDLEGISADKLMRLISCLVKDPDDNVTINAPSNTVDHDVLMELETGILIVANAADTSLSMWIDKVIEDFNFSAEGLDVFTARNMRLNSDAFGTDAADITETACVTTIHYTLEKISDEMIINLLDIL